MNLHYFQHVPFEGLGIIEAWAQNAGHRVSATRFYQEDLLPNPDSIDWLIVMGGPMNIYEEIAYPWLLNEKRFIESAILKGKIVLGICLGAQLIADVLGAAVYPNAHKEIGWFNIQKTEDAGLSRLAEIWPESIEAFHWHGDTFELPSNTVQIARSAACENQGFIKDDRIVALQFHMEITKQGLENLMANCRNEITDAPYVQTPAEMVSDDQKFKKINTVMINFLNLLATGPNSQAAAG